MIGFLTKMAPLGLKMLKFGSKHRRTIITVGSCMAAAGIAVTTIKGTIDAKEAIDAEIEKREIQNKKEDSNIPLKLTKKEIFFLCWKYYIPPAILLAMVITGVISNAVLDKKEINAIMALYTTSEAAFSGYQAIINETVDSETKEKIQQKVAKSVVESKEQSPIAKISNSPYIQNTGDGDDLMIDAWSGQRFIGSVNAVKSAVNDVNSNILNGCYDVSLNEYYYSLNIKNVQMGDEIGFSPTNLLEVSFDSVYENGKAWIVVSMKNKPLPLFDEY